MERLYTTASGHTVTLDPESADCAFLDRLTELAASEATTENDLISLGYSHENPFLDSTIHPTLGFVTATVQANPAYRAMSDIIWRKGKTASDLARLEALHVLTVADAARFLEVDEAEVRLAVKAGKLASWVREGRLMFQQAVLERYRNVRARAPRSLAREAPPLRVRVGRSTAGAFTIAGNEQLHERVRVSGNVVEGEVHATKWLGVLHRSADGHERFFLVEADRTVGETTFERDGFFVAGRFTLWTVTAGKARDLWRVWREAHGREQLGDALRKRFTLAVVADNGRLRTIQEPRVRLPAMTHYTRHRDTLRGSEERYRALCGAEMNGPESGDYLACAKEHDCAACRDAVRVMVEAALVREM